ncbi:protein BTG4 isoform X2 [Scyliorhinus canicula]|uniref:protein BTG4 isoform X2 n=1 Tax=Scyliorhinus canicula TaxID=7830 RepID=UPI0018F41857|nr:protein BTG4 isoform X2 [Scyliorhinus canicula]
MREEIAATVVFISRMVRRNENLSRLKVEKFGNKLTQILFEKYKNHWYWEDPVKGQGYRCGEKNEPFIVARLESHSTDSEIFKYISSAAERATSDYYSGTSSDEESYKEPSNNSANYTESAHPAGEEETFKTNTIPIVNNPNSIYQFETYTNFKGRGSPVEEPQTIPTVNNPKSIYQGNDYYSHPAAAWPKIRKRFPDYSFHFQKNYRVSNLVTFPRLDRYHWVNTKR